MKNRDNWRFYNCLPRGRLTQKYLALAGLEDCRDLDIIHREINLGNYNSILEVGCGEGRVIQGLLDRCYNGKINAIDFNQGFVDFLNLKKLGEKVNVRKGNVLKGNLPSADLGLWLWAGIVDFSQEEKKIALDRLSRFVKKTLVLDTPVVGFESNYSNCRGQNVEFIDRDAGTVRGYIPYSWEIQEYLAGNSFSLKKEIEYQTKTGRKRILYFLEKDQSL